MGEYTTKDVLLSTKDKLAEIEKKLEVDRDVGRCHGVYIVLQQGL